MSMEVTSTYSGYATGTYDSSIKKNTAAKSNNSTDSIEEYYEKLCKKFPEITFNKGGGLARRRRTELLWMKQLLEMSGLFINCF